MFERFTDRARRVVVLAQEEARMMDHNYIGTEHLLLGLLAEGEGVGGKALGQLGVSLQYVRDEVARIIGRGNTAVGEGHIPFTPRSKAALELALRESLQLSHNYIGTEHVLLGLLRLGEGVAIQILQKSTGGVGAVRATVLEILRGFNPPAGSSPAPTPTFEGSRLSPALLAAMETALGRANLGTVGTHHVLSVLAEWDDTAAHQVLVAGGFDASKLSTPIAEWDVAGTRDETEDAWASRVTKVIADDEGFGILLSDPDLAGRISSAIKADDPVVRAAFARLVRELQQKLAPPGDAESPGGTE